MHKETADKKHEEDLRRIANFRLMDDDFMTKCFEESPECVELVLKIILGRNDLKVIDVHTQWFVKNLLKRSVRLDILATDSQSKKYNIEIQREDKGAGRKRARYNSSSMDSIFLETGADFSELPETYVIFITENDVLGKGYPLYHIERCIMETGENFGDEAHILYVNGSRKDDTPLGKLMQDFSNTDPHSMNYKVLSERTRYFKEEGGVTVMCRAMEEMRKEALEEGRKEGILIMQKEVQSAQKEVQLAQGKVQLTKKAFQLERSGYTVSAIAIELGISEEEVQEILE